METIKVNMTPCEDVKTIHASQNDGEAREWGFELHNNGDVIDSSEITDQITFKAYKGGTEELLPSGLLNGSVDLGSLNWTYDSSVPRFYSTAISSVVAKPSNDNTMANIFCSKYATSAVSASSGGIYASGTDKLIAVGTTGTLNVKDSSYTDATAFKESLQGVYLWYQKTDSTPSTSPFDGTIKYPSGSVDSYFTYRESPTEEDGLAKITDIKGNTLVWNQLIQNGNFASASGWAGRQSTITVANNVATITPQSDGSERGLTQVAWQLMANHKYLLSVEVNPPVNGTVRTSFGGAMAQGFDTVCNANVWNKCQGIVSILENMTRGFYSILRATITTSQTIQYRNAQVFDLTQMGLDITDPSEFTSLFSLPYYDYNQGTLLSFNGNGIKTVGFNQWDEEWEVGNIDTTTGQNASANNRIRSKNYIKVLPNQTYFINANFNIIYTYDGSNNYIGQQTYTGSGSGYLFTTGNTTEYIRFTMSTGYGTTYKNDICINISDPSKNGTYEPYTSSTLSLPISTYFPNGMDGFNDVMDEKNDTGYVKRMTRATFDGSEPWYQGNPSQRFFFEGTITNFKDGSVGVATNGWEVVTNNTGITSGNNKIWFQIIGSTYRVNAYANTLGLANAQEFKAYLASNPIAVNYELATPLENYGVVDLGSLNWNYSTGASRFYVNIATLGLDIKYPTDGTIAFNGVCNRLIADTWNRITSNAQDNTIAIKNDGSELNVRCTSYSTAEAFKQAMSGVYLLYEKQNPQGFTTASLVTENTEIPLSNEDGILIGKCTEQLSSESGFFDAKIKLADGDGECYSNKIQLHIERSPQ